MSLARADAGSRGWARYSNSPSPGVPGRHLESEQGTDEGTRGVVCSAGSVALTRTSARALGHPARGADRHEWPTQRSNTAFDWRMARLRNGLGLTTDPLTGPLGPPSEASTAEGSPAGTHRQHTDSAPSPLTQSKAARRATAPLHRTGRGTLRVQKHGSKSNGMRTTTCGLITDNR